MYGTCINYEMPSALMLGMHWKRMSPEKQYYWLHKVKEHQDMCEIVENLKKKMK